MFELAIAFLLGTATGIFVMAVITFGILKNLLGE